MADRKGNPVTYPAWTILAFWGVVVGGYVVVRKIRRRRADRQWAESVARKVMQRQAEVAWLEHIWAMDSAEDRS